MSDGEGTRTVGRPGAQQGGEQSPRAGSGGGLGPGKRSLTEGLASDPGAPVGATRAPDTRPVASANPLDVAAHGGVARSLPRLDLGPSGVGPDEASIGSPSSAAVQRAPATGAPPDLGNYDSAVGDHVLVLRTWDNTTIAARRVELQGRLSRTRDTKARDELLREYEAIEWVARERNLALPKDPGEEAAPQAYMGGKPIKFQVPDNAQGMRAMLEREMAAGTGYRASREHASARIDYSTLPRSGVNRDKQVIGEQQTELMDRLLWIPIGGCSNDERLRTAQV